jgi:hypothetical protein
MRRSELWGAAARQRALQAHTIPEVAKKYRRFEAPTWA